MSWGMQTEEQSSILNLQRKNMLIKEEKNQQKLMRKGCHHYYSEWYHRCYKSKGKAKKEGQKQTYELHSFVLLLFLCIGLNGVCQQMMAQTRVQEVILSQISPHSLSLPPLPFSLYIYVYVYASRIINDQSVLTVLQPWYYIF